MDGAESVQFLLDRHHLPVVLLSGQLYLVFRGFKLNLIGCNSYLGQFITIDDLSTHEYRLNGRDRAEHTTLPHTDVGWQLEAARQQTGQLGRHLEVDFQHGLIKGDGCTCCRECRKILGECLTLLLLRLLDSITGRVEVVVVLNGQLFQLVEGIGLLGCNGTAAYQTNYEGKYLFILTLNS